MRENRMRRVRPSRLVLASVLVLSATVGACDGPSGPDTTRCPAAEVVLCTATPEAKAQTASALDDARERSLAAVGNRAVASRLEVELTDLAAALAAGQVGRARDLETAARASIDEGRAQLTSHPGDAPDLTAIELSLFAAGRLLR